MAITDNGRKLRKLKISKINLSNPEAVQLIIELIQKHKNILYSLDLSWTLLPAASLLIIAEELSEIPQMLKSLSLAYNCLNFNPVTPDYQHSVNFISKLMAYIDKSEILNHLDLSGMNIPFDHLVHLAEHLSIAPCLMGLHLSDNGLSSEPKVYNKMLEIFGIS